MTSKVIMRIIFNHKALNNMEQLACLAENSTEWVKVLIRHVCGFCVLLIGTPIVIAIAGQNMWPLRSAIK